MPLMVLGGFGLVAALAVGGYFVWDKVRDQLPTESLTAMMPVGDSPEKVLKDYADIAEDLANTLDSIRDQTTRDAAIPEIEQLTERSRALSVRAVAMGPLSSEKFESLGDWFNTQLPERKDRLEKSVERVSEMKELVSNELRLTLLKCGLARGRVPQTIAFAWQPIPGPQAETEKAQYEVTMARHRLWGQVALVASEEEYARLGTAFDAAANELEAVVEKYKDQIKPHTARSSYHSTNVGLMVDMGGLLEEFKVQYGDLPDQAAYDRYQQAELAVSKAGQANDDQSRWDADTSDPSPSWRPPQAGPDLSADQPGPAAGQPPGPGSRRPPFGPGNRPAFDPTLSPEERLERQISHFREHSPADKAVVIRITRSGEGSRVEEIVAMLKDDLAVGGHSIGYVGKKGFALFVYDGPLSDVTKNIDWAAVHSVDASTRTIHVEQKQD